jgi:hypothetical protein
MHYGSGLPVTKHLRGSGRPAHLPIRPKTEIGTKRAERVCYDKHPSLSQVLLSAAQFKPMTRYPVLPRQLVEEAGVVLRVPAG